MAVLHIGIDDTDEPGFAIGTGKLARIIAEALKNCEIPIIDFAVIRHQLLMDPAIPYTSHNSPASIMLSIDCDDSAIRNIIRKRSHTICKRLILDNCAPSSDPGICIAFDDEISSSLTTFGFHAASRVLTKQEAYDAAGAQILLEELGGTGDGIIGSAAAVGLSHTGNTGRYLEFNGLLRSQVSSVRANFLRSHGITLLCITKTADPIPDDAEIELACWPRPRRLFDSPVLLIEKKERAWILFDQKSKKEKSVDKNHD